MNTDDNSKASSEENLVDINDDLDAFSEEFFQKPEDKSPAADKEDTEDKEAVVDENEDDQLATDEDEDASEDEKPAEDEEDSDEEEEAEKPAPKKTRKSAKERIEELVAKTREGERREAELVRRLEALEAQKKTEVTDKEEPDALRDQLPADAPNPDATDKDGNPVYPLGEFDPKFIRDITKYSVTKELEAADARKAQEAENAKIAAAQKEIQEGWLERLEVAEEELPDIRENITDLVDTFQDLQPAYGEYLASVIMSSELGPQIMYYLSQNIGEAQKIVASGPAAATLAIGRLEARLSPAEKREDKRNIKQSKASPPPEVRSRGSGAKNTIAADTDDLDAFERIFFKK